MKDDLTPATKRDLQELEASIEANMDAKLQALEERIVRHFDLTVETIRAELLGANRDELEVMKDRQRSHERRIIALERTAGLATR